MEFENRVALVTGAASGIGKAVALAFAAEGATVVMADIDGAGVAAVAAEAAGEHIPVTMDVTNTESIADGVQRAASVNGRIDVLANVAGWDRIMPFMETDEALWHRVLSINFRGVLATCHAVLPLMVSQGGGAIVNTASEAGRSGSSGEAVYSGAKGGVIAFSKSLAREVARHGIRVNTVSPGLTDTPLLQSMMDAGNDKLLDAIVRATPLRRLGKPEEVAEAVLFMASDRSAFITGQTLGVGGGLVM